MNIIEIFKKIQNMYLHVFALRDCYHNCFHCKYYGDCVNELPMNIKIKKRRERY